MKAEENLAVGFDLEIKKPRYVLQLSCGLTCQLVLDEQMGLAICIWSQAPTWELMPTVLREYPRWRDEVLEAWTSSGLIPTPKVVAVDFDLEIL